MDKSLFDRLQCRLIPWGRNFAASPAEVFLDRSQAILVECGGFNARSQVLLAAAAKEAVGESIKVPT